MGLALEQSMLASTWLGSARYGPRDGPLTHQRTDTDPFSQRSCSDILSPIYLSREAFVLQDKLVL